MIKINSKWKHTEETKILLSELAKQRIGPKNGFYKRQHTEESKYKMRKAKTGKKLPPFSEEHKRKMSENNARYWLGRTKSEEHLRKMNETNSKRLKRFYATEKGQKQKDMLHLVCKGEKCYNWKGGISFLPYPAEFNKQLKELIRLRDGYKCQKCNCPEMECDRKLDIHHIDYNKKNCLPTNLISLCRKCNGQVNSYRARWIKYFQKKIQKIMVSNKIQLNLRY